MSTMAPTMPAPPGASSVPDLNRSHPFTCVTCAIAFRSSRMQRDHMRSDWHRYNLKRRVASLPPLSSEIFAEKVLSAQATNSAAAARASFEKSCQACQKTYYSENAYQNHLGSQRHRSRTAGLDDSTTDGEPLTPSVISSTISLGDPIETAATEDVEDPEVEAAFSEVVRGMKRTQLKGENVDQDDQDDDSGSDDDSERPSRGQRPTSTSATPSSVDTKTSTAMPLSRCLFCNYDSPTFKLSLQHMTKHHAMFIPEQDYLADLEGLVAYLQAKVTENYECLFCHKLKASVGGVQTHMRDKGHTMIAFDSEEEMLEIGQFYDFRSTYSDSEEEESDSDTETVSSTSTAGPASKEKQKKASAKLGARRNRAGADGEEKEEGWETDSEDEEESSNDEDEDDENPSAGKGGASKARRGHTRHHRVAYRDGHELHLPSGRTAGHRSLARYYRQNLRDYPSAAERAEQAQRLLEDRAQEDDSDGDDSAEQQAGRKQLVSRANGGLGMIGVSDATKRRVAALELKQTRKAQRDDAQYKWRVERRANNQKFFRDDNFGIRI